MNLGFQVMIASSQPSELINQASNSHALTAALLSRGQAIGYSRNLRAISTLISVMKKENHDVGELGGHDESATLETYIQ
jgi:hypothetical protein